ncbi:MAG: OsmC family protein [Planctomycetaceae bacterium]|nr:OsmC family protein [Planctomycetaceae bacterium]
MAAPQQTGTINDIDTQVVQETVEAIKDDPGLAKARFHLTNEWTGGTQNRSRITGFHVARQDMEHKQHYELSADEPPMLGGRDEAPNPVEHLLNALAACMTTSMVAHAAVRGIEIEEVQAHVEGDIDLRGFLGLAPEVLKGFSNIRVQFRVKADVRNLARLKELAMYSPVFNTLTSGVDVDVTVEPA